MIDGSAPVDIGDKTLFFAPLNLAAVRKYGSFMSNMGKPGKEFDSGRDLPIIRDILLASLRRNHPDIDEGWFDENADTRNLHGMFLAVNRASLPAAEPQTGEAKPVVESGPMTTG